MVISSNVGVCPFVMVCALLTPRAFAWGNAIGVSEGPKSLIAIGATDHYIHDVSSSAQPNGNSRFRLRQSAASKARCGPYGSFEDHEVCNGDAVFGGGNCVKNGLSTLNERFRAAGPDVDKAQLVRDLAQANNNLYYKLWTSPFSSSWKRPPGPSWKVLDDRGLYLLEGFLSDTEADQVATLFHSVPSSASGTSGANTRTCNFRRSATSFTSVGSNLPFNFQQRVAQATGTDTRDFQGTQLTRYGPGDFYSDHYDAGPCTHTDKNKDHPEVDGLKPYIEAGMITHSPCESYGRRAGTFLVYLNSKDEYNGGATYFTNMNIRVQGKKGSAIFFHPTFPDLTTDPLMLHSAEMVKSGKKIVAQQWIEFPN